MSEQAPVNIEHINLDPASLNRFFVTLPVDVTMFPYGFTLSQEQTVHHLRNVLRIKAEDHIILVDDKREKSYLAQVKDVFRDHIDVMITEQHEKSEYDPSVPYVSVAPCLIKGQRWERMLEKVTELGVRNIIPLESERAVVHLGSAEKKQQRWGTICQSAAEQSRGLYVPRMLPPTSLKEMVKMVENCQLKIVLSERGESRQPLRIIVRKYPFVRDMVVAIGPEGGWTSEELEFLKLHDFKLASLGDRILRSETAAMALMSALAYEYDTTNR